MRSILIIGAGGHGKVVCEIVECMGKWDKICFLDDDKSKKICLGYNVIGTLKDFNSIYKKFDDVFVAIGDNIKRMEILYQLKNSNVSIPTLIHPSAIISKNSILEKGCVVMAQAVINSSSKIKCGCIINTGAIIEHDCILGEGIHISPNVSVAGSVKIGKYTWVGVGASIINNINIGESCIIGAGSVVIDNIENKYKVAGIPAKMI